MEAERIRRQQVFKKTWKTSVFFITFNKKGEGLEGIIYNIHIPEGISFRGLGDLIIKMDRIYDLLDYPQSELRIRQWDNEKQWEGTALESAKNWNFCNNAEDKLSRFFTGQEPFVYVETKFRRYGSWQGILRVGKRKLSYRSDLEFISYIVGYVRENVFHDTQQSRLV